jgi:hypothetical protein
MLSNISKFAGRGANNEYPYLDYEYKSTAERNLVSYRVYIFTNSLHFEVTDSGEVEYLFVGGGGSGGCGTSTSAGGGGGGGGVITGRYSIPRGNFRIDIGAGGIAGNDTGDLRISTSGGDTTAFGLTAFGGGSGGTTVASGNTGTAYQGPLGGGGIRAIELLQSPSAGQTRNIATGGGGSSAFVAGALGTNGQGFSGGDGDATNRSGGGGGGAGGVGGNGSATKAGDGGIGFLSRITNELVYYGGGGAGGSTGSGGVIPLDGVGGLGGGANGRPAAFINVIGGTLTGFSGAANTGGGGAGGSGNNIGGNGGSGIIILRVRLN